MHEYISVCVCIFSLFDLVITGDFLNDMREGSGLETYADGSQYKGLWMEDRPHGEGIFYFPEGWHHCDYVPYWQLPVSHRYSWRVSFFSFFPFLFPDAS